MQKTSSTYAAIGKERNDCVVRTMSIVSGKAYDEVHALLKKHGRKDNKGTYLTTTKAAAKEIGFRRLTGAEINSATGSWNPTLAQFLRVFNKGTYHVHKRGHAFAVVDGVVHDWANSSAGPKCRILDVWVKGEVHITAPQPTMPRGSRTGVTKEVYTFLLDAMQRGTNRADAIAQAIAQFTCAPATVKTQAYKAAKALKA